MTVSMRPGAWPSHWVWTERTVETLRALVKRVKAAGHMPTVIMHDVTFAVVYRVRELEIDDPTDDLIRAIALEINPHEVPF